MAGKTGDMTLEKQLKKMVAGVGFEPTTFGLWDQRTTRLFHPAINGITYENLSHFA